LPFLSPLLSSCAARLTSSAVSVKLEPDVPC
jgi:hypothetical protein